MAGYREPDLLEQLTTDHEVLRVRFSELAGLPPGDLRRCRLAAVTADALVRHLTAEEEHLYPLARSGRPPGDDTVDDGLQAHAALRALVRELRGATAGSAEFDRLVARMVEAATGHFGREEVRLFPAVRERVDPVRLTALGAQVRATEAAASAMPRPGPLAQAPPDELVAPELSWHERMHRRFRFGDSSRP
ncbi:hemerythrin domain-containing protein [Kitasatospora phosalacinea]|uniref:hemerythrin domain-containing protein n=1 Tax=Kitasatospora phosalacinea TaxID=2065 RepID=UPI00068F1CB3|nr:hemerythrin domain-containing protein [Kitasatospora phosalacinea]